MAPTTYYLYIKVRKEIYFGWLWSADFFYDEMAIIVSTSVLKDSAQKFSPAIWS